MRVKGFNCPNVEVKNAKGGEHSHVEIWIDGERVGYMHITKDFADFFNMRKAGKTPYEVRSYE